MEFHLLLEHLALYIYLAMPPRRTRSSNNTRATPYDMTNINNWYSEQFRAKLAEWNIIAPSNYTKAELKSLYMANLSHRSRPNPSDGEEIPTHTLVPQEGLNRATDTDRTAAPALTAQNPPPSPIQDTIQASAIVEMMTSMTSLVKNLLDKNEKEDVSKKTLEQFSASRTSSGTEISSSSSSYGIHPELLKNTDYVSDSLKDKIVNGKYVNMASLLIPEFELSERKDKYRDARLNRSLNIEEFISAFTKYKRIHCAHHPWRKGELDEYLSHIIDISRVYGGKFYEYHKIFTQKCAVALEQGKKVNWAEKDKDLLQMIIGGTQSKCCNICKEVTHSTQFCPQNARQFGQSKFMYQYPTATTGTDDSNSKSSQSKAAICHFFNGQGCRKEKCFYSHVCKSCGSASHGLKQCSVQQIALVNNHTPKLSANSKRN